MTPLVSSDGGGGEGGGGKRSEEKGIGLLSCAEQLERTKKIKFTAIVGA